MAGSVANARATGTGRALEALANREAASRPDVASHARNVSATAAMLATDAGMPPDEVAVLERAALFHDVGKLSVPDGVLRKPGRLTPDEWGLMRRHAVDGASMLSAIPGIDERMVEVARYHHERYDGFGYEGLSGEDIPFMARVVAIADVHDALGAERDYKPRMGEDEVLMTMSSDVESPGFGRRAFDPFLLRRFVSSRLRDPSFGCSPEVRFALGEYAVSDPLGDLSPEAAESLRSGREPAPERDDLAEARAFG